GVWSTSRTAPTRGGATSRAFELALVQNAPLTHARVYSADEMWANHQYFVERVLPVAEEAGVKLALHPDDPPVPSLGGVARIASSFEGFRRIVEANPSPNHGLNFCMGCWSEMGTDVVSAIRYFGARRKIIYGHFRDVQGTAEKFQECFLGEGNVNIVAAMRALHATGFTGFLIDDHVPHMQDDTPWGHRGRALSTGIMVGLLAAIQATA
ncbi:MAG: mannonate dehydratase, partial [Actinobacteria bacterium]|nr:mannonate dehydratase [Actinomycetota bacterium]